MTYKQIEASREARLWITTIIVPACMFGASIMSIPEVREAVAAKARQFKESIEGKLKKRS